MFGLNRFLLEITLDSPELLPGQVSSYVTLTKMEPSMVNLSELLIRLIKICLILVESDKISFGWLIVRLILVLCSLARYSSMPNTSLMVSLMLNQLNFYSNLSIESLDTSIRPSMMFKMK
jgi:hypothetical protein